MVIIYRASRVLTICIFYHLIPFLLLYAMNTRKTDARKVKDEVANVGADAQGSQVPPQVQVLRVIKFRHIL